MRTEAERAEWALQCYGMSEAELESQIESGLNWYGSKAFLMMSMLSDVQELMARATPANLETARQRVNCIKRMLSDYSKQELAHLHGEEAPAGS